MAHETCPGSSKAWSGPSEAVGELQLLRASQMGLLNITACTAERWRVAGLILLIRSCCAWVGPDRSPNGCAALMGQDPGQLALKAVSCTAAACGSGLGGVESGLRAGLSSQAVHAYHRAAGP